jgi:LPS-assembly lipoprotein
MWWRNPTRRHVLRLAAIAALAGAAGGCFQPLYGARPGGPDLRNTLASIDVERIDAPNGTAESRIAVELQNALAFTLTGGSGTISPTHRLRVRFVAARASAIVDPSSGRVEVEITGLDATYTLTELATNKPVLNGRAFSRVTSDTPGQQQRFARYRARAEAEDRATKVIAEQIRNRLASFFVAGT